MVGQGEARHVRQRVAKSLVFALALCAWMLAADAAHAAKGKPKPPPNVVVIQTDDQALGTFTSEVMPQTVAKLQERGTTFSQAIVSTPQCCPSRAAFFTGQYAHNNGVLSNIPGYPLLENPQSVLPAWLQKAGYRTAHIGKFMNGYQPAIVPAPGWTRWRTALDLDYVNPAFSFDGRFVEPAEYITSVINEQAVTAIEKLSPGRKPFYVHVDQLAPHLGSRKEPGRCAGGPIPPSWDENLFAGSVFPPAANVEEADVADKPDFIRRKPVASASQRERIDLYYGCALATLRSVDRGVSAVLGALRRTDELANTMVVFTSDNGYSYGEHRVALTKGLAYEEHLRVPLVVRPPKGFPKEYRQGATVPAPVANVDLAPTFVQLAGAKPCAKPGGCRRLDGRSLVPLLRGKEPGWAETRAIKTSFDINNEVYPLSCTWTGFRTPQLSFIEHSLLPANGTSNECIPATFYERYDLAADPLQLDNLGFEATQAGRLDRLERCSGIQGRDKRQPGVPFCE
jgi:N-acetylglucosamine-6-sulfatase